MDLIEKPPIVVGFLLAQLKIPENSILHLNIIYKCGIHTVTPSHNNDHSFIC